MPIFNPILVGKQLPTLTTPGAASDLASGKQLIGQDGEIVTGNVPVVTELSMTGTPSVSGSNLVIGRPSTMRAILPYQVPVKMDAPLTSLGDAAAADVVSGKTFTSTAGLKVTGTYQPKVSIEGMQLMAEGSFSSERSYDLSGKTDAVFLCTEGASGSGEQTLKLNGYNLVSGNNYTSPVAYLRCEVQSTSIRTYLDGSYWRTISGTTLTFDPGNSGKGWIRWYANP